MAQFLVTGALPYSNGRLHVGHIAGAYLPADIYVRYLRLAGHDVRFICGSDDNGVAALKSALKENKSVEELTAYYREKQAQAFKDLGIEFDVYGGTHSFEPVSPDQPEGQKICDLHAHFSQDLFRKVYDCDYFTKKTEQQYYDEQAQQFLPDRYVTGACPNCQYEDANAGQCEQCHVLIEPGALVDAKSALTGTTPVLKDTTHWYLKLQDLSPVLKKWLGNKPIGAAATADKDGLRFPWRSFVANQALGIVESGLHERAMTRDLSWGVPVPIDDPDAKDKVLYVWFDAPIGYITFTAVDCVRRGEPLENYKNWWHNPDCHIVHFIGEDNIVFHALTWPSVLLASRGTLEEVTKLDAESLDDSTYQIPEVVCANAYLNFELPSGDIVKQSKGKGTAVFIDEYVNKLDPDPLRYYLTVVAPESARSVFSWSDFFTRNNNELVATLGNFVNRYQKIVKKHFERKVPSLSAELSESSKELLEDSVKTRDEVGDLIQGTEFKRALERAFQFARHCNGYINDREPWNRVNPKKELPGKPVGEVDLEHAAETVKTCLDATRTLGIVLEPFLPATTQKIRGILALTEDHWQWAKACDGLDSGHALGPAQMLFKKLDPAKVFPES